MQNSPTPNMNYSIATGANSTNPFLPVLLNRNPTANDVNYAVTQRWINLLTGAEYILTGFTSGSSNPGGMTLANWLLLGSQGTVIPAFSYYPSAPETNVTGDGTPYTLGSTQLYTKYIDALGNVTQTPLTFTAPITGNYFIGATIGMRAPSAPDYWATPALSGLLVVNIPLGTENLVNLNPGPIANAPTGGARVVSMAGSVFIPLTSGQSITWTLTISGSTKMVTIQSVLTAPTLVYGFLVQ